MAAEVVTTAEVVEATEVTVVVAAAGTEARATNLALWWLNKGHSRSCTRRQDLSCPVMNSRL